VAQLFPNRLVSLLKGQFTVERRRPEPLSMQIVRQLQQADLPGFFGPIAIGERR
jgi:hypothetical protein